MCPGDATRKTSFESRLGLDQGTLIIIVTAWLFDVLYLSYTSISERSIDVWAQLQYIAYLTGHHAVPSALNCTVCHHPPLYYAIGAVFSSIGTWAKWQDVPRALQYLSVGFAGVYLVFGALTLRLFVRQKTTRWVGTALFAFFPGNIIASARIHNDGLANALMVAAVYFILVWWLDARQRDLFIGTCLVGLTLLTKSTGVIPLGLLVALAAARLYQSSERLTFARKLVPSIGVLVFTIGLRNWLRVPLKGVSTCFANLGRACAEPSAHLDHGISSYLWLDLKPFLKLPFLLLGPSSVERGNFWNCFFKSGLFGFYPGVADPEMSAGLNTQLALAANGVLLGLLVLGVVLATRVGIEWYRRQAPLLLLCAGAVAFLMLFRLAVPNPHHGDMRHALGLTAWGSTLLMTLVERRGREAPIRYFTGLGLGLLMVAVSIAFFVPKLPYS